MPCSSKYFLAPGCRGMDMPWQAARLDDVLGYRVRVAADRVAAVVHGLSQVVDFVVSDILVTTSMAMTVTVSVGVMLL